MIIKKYPFNQWGPARCPHEDSGLKIQNNVLTNILYQVSHTHTQKQTSKGPSLSSPDWVITSTNHNQPTGSGYTGGQQRPWGGDVFSLSRVRNNNTSGFIFTSSSQLPGPGIPCGAIVSPECCSLALFSPLQRSKKKKKEKKERNHCTNRRWRRRVLR